MTKNEMIQETIEIAEHNMDWFIGIIGVTVALFALFQWRFTDKQIEKMKSEILQQVNNTYEARIKKLENALNRYKKYQTSEAMSIANSLNNKFFELETCDDPIKLSLCSNDIINTIKSIVNNNMVDNFVKVAAMAILNNNIKTAKNNGQESKIKNIYQSIMKDDKAKTYYQSGQHLFNEPEKENDSKNK